MERPLAASARVATPFPERYAKQLVSHLGNKLEFASTDVGSTTELDGALGTISVKNEMLVLEVEAPNADSLAGLQDVFARHLERFGQREGLTVEWNTVTR